MNHHWNHSRATRGFLLFAATLALLAAPLSPATAQAFPSRPVRLVVGTNPGGGADFVARLLAAKLQDQLRNPAIVENRPGASGAIGADIVSKAAPDGHTLLLAFAAQMVMNPVVQEKISYDPVRDFEPITMLSLLPLVLVVNPSLQVSSVSELIGRAKANAGKLDHASGASSFFFVNEIFKQRTGIDIRSIPFTGSAQAVAAVLADTVPMAFVDIPPAIAHIRSGRLRALGVTTGKRVAFLPDVPAVAETVPGFEFVLWIGMFAPAGTPQEVIARLQKELVRAVDAPDVKEKMALAGIVPSTGTPQELGETLRRDLALIRRLAQATGTTGK